MGTREQLERCFDRHCCLCLGAGVTSGFVGTWKQLLGKLLGRRFVSAWLSDGQPFSDIAAYADEGFFSDFFVEEGNLELGEFLLADDSVDLPGVSAQDKMVWQERLFSRQVSEVVQTSVEEALSCNCVKTGCAKTSTCPMQHARILGELYDAYLAKEDFDDFGNSDKNNKTGREDCALRGCATTMAVVELCASGKVPYVINYNFDIVVERMLFEAIASGRFVTPVREIHVWTYGDPREPQTPQAMSDCKLVFHQGVWDSDTACLTASNAIHFFHVHGVTADHFENGVSNQLIFSQHSYQIYQESPLNWSNQVLQYLFSRCDVAAVGFSGSDENFRSFAALHRRSSMEGLSAYIQDNNRKVIFLRATQSYREAIENKVGTENDTLAKFLLKYCTAMVSDYYKDYFDVDVMWVDDYLDIAKTLRDIAGR